MNHRFAVPITMPVNALARVNCMEASDSDDLIKRDAALLAGLRLALAGDEHRLYETGKTPGLFSSRTGPTGEAATLALREGLLEYARTETRGRFEIDWVRMTARGVDYLYQHDSPKAVLQEMRDLLANARSGVPRWQDEILQSMEKFASHITEEMTRYMSRLEAIAKRVDEALRRAEVSPELAPGLRTVVPWGLEAVSYLDRRHASGAPEHCPLPELFGAVRMKHGEISLRDFHDGLRRLAEASVIQLAPWVGPGSIPQPEHACLHDGRLVYLVSRK